MKLKYFKIFLFFLCISCGYTNKEISQIVKEWQNKEIIFPYSLQSKIMGKDTACNYLLNKKYKILLYVDSTACTECKLQLYEWYKLIYRLSLLCKLLIPKKLISYVKKINSITLYFMTAKIISIKSTIFQS